MNKATMIFERYEFTERENGNVAISDPHGSDVIIRKEHRPAVALALLTGGGVTDELIRTAADGLREWHFGKHEGMPFSQAYWDEQASAVLAAIFRETK